MRNEQVVSKEGAISVQGTFPSEQIHSSVLSDGVGSFCFVVL
jgi:hypothetical protein